LPFDLTSKLEIADYFFKSNTSSGGNEGQTNEID
jgi:hypothetical protein